MKTIYYCGNVLVPEDSGIINVLPSLQQSFPNIHFIHLDPTEGIPQVVELIILDTIVGIDQVMVFDSLIQFTLPPRFTVHDYDLLHDLQLLVKLKKIERFCLIGVPVGVQATDSDQVRKIIDSIMISSS